jgi:TRAP-type C4-dicarboxylate transport system substrate-binding protein
LIRSALLPLCIAVALVTAGCLGGRPGDKTGAAASVPATVIELEHQDDGTRDVGRFAAAVRRLSHGTLEIRVRGNAYAGEIDYERSIIADVRAGRSAMGKVGARAWDLVGVKSFEPLVAPFAITSLAQEERVLRSPTARAMLASVRPLGLEGIAILPAELRYPVGVTRDALRPADFHDATVGIRPSGMARATFAALGGVARDIVPGGSYRGFDVVEQDTMTLSAAIGFANARSITANVPLWPRAQTIVMGRAGYDRLTDEQRNVLARAAAEAIAPQRRALEQDQATLLRGICRDAAPALLQAPPASVAALHRAVAPVLDGLRRDPAMAAALDAIDGMRAGSDALRCPPETATPAPADEPTPVDATWTADVTRAAYFAARPFDGEDHEANWGRLTMRLDKGRFRLENARFPGGHASGAYVVRDDELLMYPDASPNEGAGEIWRYRWSRYRGTLRLSRIDPQEVPTALLAVPWIEAG